MGTTTPAAGLGTSYYAAIQPLSSPANIEIIQDTIAAMIAGGTQTNITIAYNDTTGTLSFTASGVGGGGPGGDVFGPVDSADGELPLFNGVTGKQLGRSSGLTGFLQLTAGIVSALTSGQLKTALALVKGDVGLANADNTSDANKPISTLQQAALDTKLSLGGGIMTGAITLAGPAANALEPVTKQQLDDRSEGFQSKGSARMRTAAALPSCTYNNGTLGVGATLTGNANGALAAVDGLTPVAGDVIAVGDQAVQSQNGLYVLTQLGDSTHPFILTRATNMDKATEFGGAFVFVGFGTAAGRFLYSTFAGTFVVGTTALTWSSSSATLGTTDALPEGTTNLYFTTSRVLNVVLGGLNLTINAAITAGDSVLSAMGKLQKQITDALTTLALKANAASAVLTGVVTHSGADVVAGTAVTGNQIDFNVGRNDYTIAADQSVTFINAATDGQSTGVRLKNTDTADHTLTLPAGGVTHRSQQKQALITTILAPAGCDWEFLLTRYTSTLFKVSGEPQLIEESGWDLHLPTTAATRVLELSVPGAGKVFTEIDAKCSAGTTGTIDLKLQINGTDVTGAAVTAVGTTLKTGAATALNKATNGQTVTLVVANNSLVGGFCDVTVKFRKAAA